MALNPDGSEDNELWIKDLPDIKVGNWERVPVENSTESSERTLRLS
jgi:hypothetical protein